ncbi:hypothetical protein DFH09DRAFT_1127027 [Mycena vulgaris]|nr:hypothetical protein DFH09DRAFT_1127027 [Mycena vulgaris]
MAPNTPVERIRLEDILLPVASTSSTPPPPSRRSQVARKSTGRMPPRTMIDKESSPMSESPGPRKNPSQCARKSTGGIPPKFSNFPSPMTTEAFLDPSDMPIRNTTPSARKSRGTMPFYRRPIDATGTPDSDETDYSRAGSSDTSSSRIRMPPVKQSDRKSTGGLPPRRQIEELTESTPSPRLSPLPIIPVPNLEPAIPCGLCRAPLQTIYVVSNPSQPIHHFLTRCQHHFHHICYLNYITTASPNERTHCPQCQASVLTSERYWVHATTNTGNECNTDITEDVEARLFAARQARQQIFIDMLNSRNFQIALSLLTGPDAVDVNYGSPVGGHTPLHLFATINDVVAIEFLLSHGADKNQQNDNVLSPLDCARSSKAWDAVKRLA